MKSEKAKARIEFLYRTKYLPAYLLFIALYPFGLEDLPGEIWVWIKDYKGLYQISNYGRVKSFPRNTTSKIRIMKPLLSRSGYLYVSLKKKKTKRFRFEIHRLVALAFIPNPENKTTVNHKDGIKLNNCVENLEWATKSENMQHSYDIGLRKSSNLTLEDVKHIREIYIPSNREYGARALSKKFGVAHTTILDIVHGKSYKNID